MAVLSISSHVVAGRIGNAIALPAFAALGITAWSLPTVIYSQTPSPAGFAGESVPFHLLDAILDRFESDGTTARLDAVHVGYVRDADAATRIARFLAIAQTANPRLFVSVDPVLGDEGRLYIPEATAQAIKDDLLPLADLATPNLFELGWLTGKAIASIGSARAAAHALGPAQVLVTSAPAERPDEIATLLVAKEHTLAVTTPRLTRAPHGTGDLLAALFLGRLLRMERDAPALEHAVASVYDLAVAAGDADALPIVQHPLLLASPVSRFKSVRTDGETRA